MEKLAWNTPVLGCSAGLYIYQHGSGQVAAQIRRTATCSPYFGFLWGHNSTHSPLGAQPIGICVQNLHIRWGLVIERVGILHRNAGKRLCLRG